MKLSALRFADFSSLGEAVTDWSEMVKKLKNLADDAHDQLKGKADKASWAGVNATVTRDFITKTAREFQDAHHQAQSIHNILKDTKSELEGYKKQLNDRIERGVKEHNLTVTETGDSFTVTMNAHPDRSTKPDSLPEHNKGDVEALRDDIQSILNKATTSDSTAAEALRAIVDAPEKGFADVSYKDRDSAAKALQEAKRLAQLAKHPGKLSPKEFDELNRGLKRYHDDDLFSEKFATTLGARGTLQFWATLNDPHDSMDLAHARLGQYDDLQKNLGLTLAHATQSDSPSMRNWEHSMVNLGGAEIRTGSHRTKGFPIMSSLMRWGDFDDKFLGDYGNKLMAEERKATRSTGRADLAWNDPMGLQLNRTGTDTGRDPMTGYMDALGHSPDAATKFFNTDYGDLQSDEHKKTLSNFDYLMKERNWVPDHNSHMHNGDAGHDAMGRALEAATTGHPAGSKPTLETIPHNQQQADLYSKIVHSVSKDPDLLNKHRSMGDSFGKISAEYMPDIHRALDPAQHAGRLYPIAGATAPDLGKTDMTRFLYTVGRDPDGYAAINIGQHNYTAALMQYHFQHPGAFPGDPNVNDHQELNKTIGHISTSGGEIQGIIGAGRAYEGEVDGGAKDAEFNDALGHAKNWTSGLVGVGVGVATAPFSGPGGIVAGGVATTGAGELLDGITDGLQKDSSGEVIYRNGEQLGGTEASTYQLMEKSAHNAAAHAHHPSPYIEDTASSAARTGFNSAARDVRWYVDGQGIPGQLEKEGN